MSLNSQNECYEYNSSMVQLIQLKFASISHLFYINFLEFFNRFLQIFVYNFPQMHQTYLVSLFFFFSLQIPCSLASILCPMCTNLSCKRYSRPFFLTFLVNYIASCISHIFISWFIPFYYFFFDTFSKIFIVKDVWDFFFSCLKIFLFYPHTWLIF